MDVWTIHCPKCNHRLRVPENSGGKPARCPACKTVFRIPHEGEMIDETVVCWLDLDRLNEEDETEGQAAASAPSRPAPGKPAPASQPPSTPDKQPQKQQEDDEDLDEISLDEIMKEIEPQTDGHGSFVAFELEEEEDDEVAPPKEWGKSDRPKAADKAPPSTQPATDSSSYIGPVQVNEQQERAKELADRRAARARAMEQQDDADRFKLHLVDVGSFGVRFSFDSRLINLPSFRASMPFKCMVTGQTDPAKLVAKPLVWIDKNSGKFVDPGELETRYERQVKAGQSARELAQNMPTLDELPPPFNQPIPYYVVKEHIGKYSIHSEAFATPYGLRCEVVIPFANYALEWLGRVNGVIGEEYAQLENEVLRFEAKAWRAIPIQVRNRLGVWFDFHSKEQFLGYFNDSDFAKADAGLAGLVVTDHRLVYCKYHNQGEIPLESNGTLIAEPDGPFFQLKYRSDKSTRKLVRLRPGDIKTLKVILDRVQTNLKLQAPPDQTPASSTG